MLCFLIFYRKRKEEKYRVFLSDYDKLKEEFERSHQREKIMTDLCNHYQNTVNKKLDGFIELYSNNTNNNE